MTEPRKTPRTDAAELPWVANTQVACYGPCVKSDFARSLEIETQELAEVAMELLTATSLLRLLVKSHRPALAECGDFKRNTEAMRQMESALARHRAKQEVKP